jgi:signal transduction histidine kinase
MPRSQNQSVVTTLLRLGVTRSDDWDAALQQVLEVCCELLEVERASYWTFRDHPPGILCELGYVQSKRLFERGVFLAEERAPAYFQEIRAVQVLAVADVRADPRLRDLSDYLTAHRIGAILDVPVFSQGELVGVLCHESTDGPREWTPHDSELALTLSHTLSGLVEARARHQAEKFERRAAFLADVSTALAQALDLERSCKLAVRRALPELGDMCSLIGYDGQRAWRIAAAHLEPAGQRLLDELCARFGADIDGPGLGVQALRERQSLLLQIADEEALRETGLPPGQIELLFALRVRSMMAVPLTARGVVTGALTFACRGRNYDREDLLFAEQYALQVGILLDNARLYTEAQAAIGARDDFLNLAGHELRTPLTSLQLAVDLLQKSLPDPPPAARRALDTISRQATRLSRLTELIVLAAQHGASTLPLQPEAFDLAELVRDVARDFADQLARAGCELRLQAGAPVPVYGDRTGLEVVVSNLLANAMKFGKGAPIDLTVRRSDGAAQLVVVDRGIGIPREQLRSVFERYGRAVSPTHFGGLGLGLHITAQIVQALGGQIRAESDPGEGASFIVELPGAPPT